MKQVETGRAPMPYEINCYDKNGNLERRSYAETLEQAERIRLSWAKRHDITEFGYMPTIWKYDYKDAQYNRMEGY